ncbi:Qat anti-phage system associated protein QatB [Tardiphaga sp. 538_B7_N1_4]|jgi:hypothetical protein|uniref:Qat anti-phage system associated protein QatB n=1 Tax=unclassified Tardiphaga TaxID=2631404 RepID=UPI001B8A7EA0|nr:Qat anti-phage system associated protein QatB [Bradyrhizobium diazoefficiens]MBR0962539.1 hypothetical protein [Bradyrhizobium diazoefficiens]MBR0976699.1 hypothetical protein [Bradyrhizobium diazoefficiens]MBR1005344.1 hypothetical protein [Bradyrhizobium diazoefficiens]MBR1011817.1 hypothetical protein [Bradyrhizobium diazoefficiens]MBR1049158.1 hypothetical protein [Bradyrhizobium diazoefficiens]
MGTSNAYGGAAGNSALVPTWLQGEANNPGAAPGSEPASGAGPSDQPPSADPNPPAVPVAPAARPAAPIAGAADRFTSARNNFSRFASSGGGDRQSLGRAVSQYVSKATGGSRQAAQRMGSARGAGAGLVRFLNDASTNGVREALRTLNLESLAGRPIEEVFAGLADYICPEGGAIDEGIARDAFIETIADLAGAGITDIDALTPAQIQTVFELYATHAIEARLCNDIGTKVITLPTDPSTAERIEAQLRDFIHRGVSDTINAAGVNIQSLTPEKVLGFVTDVYQAAFEALQTLGDAEAEK